MKIKIKTNKWDLIKLESFCRAKETIKKMKTTHRMEENICKQPTNMRLWAEDLNRHFSKEDIEDFPDSPVVKNPPANTKNTGLIPGPGRFHVPWGN